MADENCPVNSIDSDATSLAISEEKCLKTPADNPVWYGLEPNSYSDFGPNFTTVARAPIVRNRQNQKGSLSGIEVPAGWNTDITANNMARLFQGFIYADMEQQKTNLPVNGTVIASVSNSDNTNGITFSADVSGLYSVNDIVVFRNAPAGASSLPMVVTGQGGTADAPDNKTIKVDGQPGTFAGTAQTEVAICGFRATAWSFAATDGQPLQFKITDSGFDFTKHDVSVGMWLALADLNASNIGFGRVSVVTADTVTFDDWTFDTGTFKADGGINVFTPDIVRNAIDPDDIVKRSYMIERRLGHGGQYDQAEYIIGAVPNTATITFPDSNNVTTDLVFVGCEASYKDGTSDVERPLTDTQTFVPPIANESAFTTATDIALTRMVVKGDYTGDNPGAAKLFGFISEANISINNNVTSNTAVGVFGPFSVTAGKFTVGGSITAYFQKVAALRAARENKTAQFTVIGANGSGGFVFDIPSLTVTGARVTVASSSPITLPLTPAGFEDNNGYTLAYQRYSYLPSIPDAQV